MALAWVPASLEGWSGRPFFPWVSLGSEPRVVPQPCAAESDSGPAHASHIPSLGRRWAVAFVHLPGSRGEVQDGPKLGAAWTALGSAEPGGRGGTKAGLGGPKGGAPARGRDCPRC